MDPDLAYPTIEDQMQLAGELSRESIRCGIGGLLGRRSSTGRRTSCSPPV
ncbi:MAG TPA: hypothetical protein VI027_16105 [Rubrobacteraceae bacterium]